MELWHKLTLNRKLLTCFFAAIFMLSLLHLFSYHRLLNAMTQEAQTSTNERMSSAVTQLDERLSAIQNNYLSLTHSDSYRKALRLGQSSEYDMVDLFRQGWLHLNGESSVSAFAILFRNSDQVVTSGGNYSEEEFFTRCYSNESYTLDFWQQEKKTAFSQRYYPAAVFLRNSPISTNEDGLLLPVAFKSYWNQNVMVVLFLDMRTLCESVDPYLEENFYLFAGDGTLLYTTQEKPLLHNLPEQSLALTEAADGSYIAQHTSKQGDLICVKVLEKNAVVGQVTNSLYFSLFTALAALVLALSISVVSVGKLMHPVQDILHMLPGGKTDGKQGGELRYIQSNIEQMMCQHEQYARRLARKDASLSGFLLQSQLKNIYVDLDDSDNALQAADCTFYILYLRIHYREGTLENIPQQPALVSHMFLESLQRTMDALFQTVLAFQLEPGQFVAKISMPTNQSDIEEPMRQLLRRLENEQEFAFFTVVRSGPLAADDDYTSVYNQVLDAAQYAKLENRTQLIRLPVDLKSVGQFSFPAEQEQQLFALVRAGRQEEVASLCERLLQSNLSRGICRIHMALLCSSVIGTAVRALSELNLKNELSALNSSNVYNKLMRCDTDHEYCELVSSFVRSAALCAVGQLKAGDAILEGVQAFLEANYQREFSMDELADALHISKSYLSTYYKNKTGTNLSDRIQFFRIQKAVAMLVDPKLKMSEISERVGINNMNTFLRQFKKYTGMTPTEYRMSKLPSASE